MSDMEAIAAAKVKGFQFEICIIQGQMDGLDLISALEGFFVQGNLEGLEGFLEDKEDNYFKHPRTSKRSAKRGTSSQPVKVWLKD